MATAASNWLAQLARRTELNHDAMILYIVLIFSVFGFTVVVLLLQRIATRRSRPLGTVAPVVSCSRKIRTVLLARVPGLPSVPSIGHLLVIVVYLVFNFIVTFIKFDNKNLPLLNNVSSRTGWMAIANTLVLAFLALKNTPLAFLIPWSHDRLNIFHRVAGYVTVVDVIVHACCYSVSFAKSNSLSNLTEMNIIYGMIAGFCYVGAGLSGAIVRKWSYELFYVIHIVCWILGIITTTLHQKNPNRKIMQVTVTAAGIWLLDRTARGIRHLCTLTNNTVTLTPLPEGGTRVTFAKAPPGAAMGRHGFIWIPAIRVAETHPFTMATTEPLQFVVSAQDGFTRSLHDYALKYPGAVLRASVDGPYGSLPDLEAHDKAILVAGGSGATFTIGSALSMLKTLNDNQSIVFIWAIKNAAYLTWFADQISILMNDPRVNVLIYVTRRPQTDYKNEPSVPSSSASNMPSQIPGLEPVEMSNLGSNLASFADPEKGTVSSIEDAVTGFPITYGRPDVAHLLKSEIDVLTSDKRVLIMSCGPGMLTESVRSVAVEKIGSGGPSIDLHCEQFGW